MTEWNPGDVEARRPTTRRFNTSLLSSSRKWPPQLYCFGSAPSNEESNKHKGALLLVALVVALSESGGAWMRAPSGAGAQLSPSRNRPRGGYGKGTRRGCSRGARRKEPRPDPRGRAGEGPRLASKSKGRSDQDGLAAEQRASQQLARTTNDDESVRGGRVVEYGRAAPKRRAGGSPRS